MAAEQVICDTDVMIDFWDCKNQRHSATKNIIEGTIGIDNVILTAITKIELLKGAINKTDIQKISKRLLRFNIELIEAYSLSNGLALPDSFVAATAMTMNLRLFYL
jgi:predicted nucleic acid-binding protein